MLSVPLPQASMPELMCGWGCHMGFPCIGRLKAAVQALDAIGASSPKGYTPTSP
jgi:hypothetical protein